MVEKNLTKKESEYEVGYFSIFIITLFLYATLLLLLIFKDYNHKPAPRFTNSFSLNEKVKWFNNISSCEILIIGSSIALNGIDGLYLQEKFKDKTIINVSAWGLTVNDISKWIEIIANKCTPKIIIYALNLDDFCNENSINDWSEIEYYLNNKYFREELSYFRNLDGVYYMRTYLDKYRKFKFQNKIYDSILFDHTGGVLLDSNDFNVNPLRWDGLKIINAHRECKFEENFKFLNKLRDIATKAEARFLISTTPIREAAMNKNSEKFTIALSENIDSNFNDIIFLNNTINLKLDDTNFVDYVHLNKKGAKILTESIVTKLNN
jgi:hypothetical protein